MGCSCVDPKKPQNNEYTIIDANWLKSISTFLIYC